MRIRSILSAFILSLICSFIVIAQNDPTVPLHLEYPVAPTPFQMGSKTQFLYEIHITNFRSKKLELTQIDIFNGKVSSEPLAVFKETELTEIISNPGVRKKGAKKRILEPGQRTVVFLEVSIDNKMQAPKILRHRLYIKPPGSEAALLSIEDKGVQVSTKPPPIISAPLRGSWISFNGISNNSGHRRTMIPLGGRANISQRFAIDWIKMGADGKVFKNGPTKNEEFHGYGADVLAVASGVVADVKDGIPENDMATGKRAVKITLETIGGNYVIIDIGNGYYAFYAHLIPKSIRVKVGDKVTAGQVIGKVGNSGNSDAPHLHFHIADGNSPIGAEGVPYLIKSFQVQGRVSSVDKLFSGEIWKPNPAKDLRTNEIPTENSVIRFRPF